MDITDETIDVLLGALADQLQALASRLRSWSSEVLR
jgi:hypothetical protein